MGCSSLLATDVSARASLPSWRSSKFSCCVSRSPQRTGTLRRPVAVDSFGNPGGCGTGTLDDGLFLSSAG